MHYKRFLK